MFEDGVRQRDKGLGELGSFGADTSIVERPNMIHLGLPCTANGSGC